MYECTPVPTYMRESDGCHQVSVQCYRVTEDMQENLRGQHFVDDIALIVWCELVLMVRHERDS